MTEEVDFINTESKFTLKDGVLHFESKEQLKDEIEKIKNQSESENTSYFKFFYDNGFSPLYPRFSSNDNEAFKKFFELKNSKYINIHKNNNELEVDDNLISDDNFASFLNINRELVVNDTLYKYTHHGIFKTHFDNKLILDNYIVANQINEFNAPNPETITRGEQSVNSVIKIEIPILTGEDPCSNSPGLSIAQGNNQYDPLDNLTNNCPLNGGTSGSGGASSNVNHKQSLINYMSNLEPCDVSNVGLWGWTIFGTAKKCYSYHNNDNRVKTKYWDENYGIYTSIGVKVKHHYKGLFGWRTKDTDEVALAINRAVFTATVGNSVPGTTPFQQYATETNRLFYIAGGIYANSAQALTSVYQPFRADPDLIPKTPFKEDIIIQDYINLPILNNLDPIEVTADKLNQYFWSSAWTQTRNLMLNKTGSEPDKITYILTTPQKIYMMYIDVDSRQLNTDKIVNVLGDDWGAEIEIVLSFNANGSITTSFDDFNNNTFRTLRRAITLGDLTDFDGVSMDFVGATRMGNSWKGSRILYNK